MNSFKPLVIKVNGVTYETLTNRERRAYYWHGIAKNGNIVADGSQGHSTHSNAKRALRRHLENVNK